MLLLSDGKIKVKLLYFKLTGNIKKRGQCLLPKNSYAVFLPNKSETRFREQLAVRLNENFGIQNEPEDR